MGDLPQSHAMALDIKWYSISADDNPDLRRAIRSESMSASAAETTVAGMEVELG